MEHLSGRVIKHKRFLDVCFDVTKVLTLPHKHVITGYWLNMAYVESYPLGIKDTFSISNVTNWMICMEAFPRCYRDANWRQMRGK